MKTLKKTLIATALAAAGFAGHAQAQSLTDTFNVTLTVDGTCAAVTGSDIAFGAQSGINAEVDQPGSISVQCTRGHPYELQLSAGLHANDAEDRKLQLINGARADFIRYNLYHDTYGGTTWGDTDAGHEPVTGTGNGLGAGSAVNHAVYARAVLTGEEAVGDYSDTVTATLTF